MGEEFMATTYQLFAQRMDTKATRLYEGAGIVVAKRPPTTPRGVH